MTENLKHIFSEALALSPMERAELVEKILTSFEFPNRKMIDEAWITEVEERIDKFEEGRIEARPAQDVFKQIDNI